MLVRGFVRTIKTGMPVPDGVEVEFRLHADNSLLTTAETVNGMYEVQFTGSPGPYYVRVNYAEETHVSSSKVVGMSGPVDIGGLPLYFRLWTDGYIPGVLGQLAVSASGAGMQVAVGSGVALVRGVLYDQPTSQTFAIAAADVQPRIDTVVVEVVPPGAGADIEGRTRIRVKKGVAASSPVAPSLTQTTSLWEFPLANVRVEPGVSSIASDKVTNRRVQASASFADGSVTEVKIAPGAVTNTRLASGAVSYSKILDDSVRTGHILDGNVTEAKLSQAVRDKLNAQVEGGDTSTPLSIVSKDTNFGATGIYSGGMTPLTGATASVSVPAGTWFIETILNITLRGSGSSTSNCSIQLSGNATPQGDSKSLRMFYVGGGDYNSVMLSGRRTLTVLSTTTLTAYVERTHVGGPAVDFRDGALFLKAFKVG